MKKAFPLSMLAMSCFAAAFALTQFTRDSHDRIPSWVNWTNLTLFIIGIVIMAVAVVFAFRGRNNNG